jgi:nitrogen fixation NifU-like protein
MSIDIYKENILEHFEEPRNFGHLEKYDVRSKDSNPLCGDSFVIEIKIKDDQVIDVKFSGHGCAISTASASMLTEKIKGMSLEEIKKLDKKDILNLLNIELSHVRIKCALLPLKIIKLGVYEFLDKA